MNWVGGLMVLGVIVSVAVLTAPWGLLLLLISAPIQI